MISWKNWIKNSQRVYMIPTRYGAACGFLFLFFTITAAHYSNNLIFLLAFILVSFLIIAILQTTKNLRGIKIKKIAIDPGFPSDTSYAHILLENTRGHTKIGLGIQFYKQKKSTLLDEISNLDQQWINVPIDLPNKRGFYQIERIKIFTDAPYGLFYGWYYIYEKHVGLVYPAPKGLPLKPPQESQYGGDFSGLKSYQTGDSMARVSWKHSAKRDDLLLKEFSDDEPQVELYKLVDCPQLDIEDKLSQLCLWILNAEVQNKKYALILNASHSTTGRGEAHLKECLSSLGAYSP